MKKITSMVGAFALSALALFSSCSASNGGKNSDAKVSAQKEILVVSFGTSYNSSRNITIGGIESAIRERYPEYKVVRAFTADTIINILKERDGINTYTVAEALDKAVADGVKTLVVQPTHLMDGFEYNDLKKDLEKYSGKFDSLVLGEPLLSSDADYKKVADAITAKTASYDDGKTAICFMGHGTEAPSNKTYAKMLKNRVFL